MKKILFFIILFITVSCSTQKNVFTEYETPRYMKTEMDTLVTKNGFGNICYLEGISWNLNKWTSMPFKDYETKKNVYKYLYISDIGDNECIYLLIIRDDKYNLIKRVTIGD